MRAAAKGLDDAYVPWERWTGKSRRIGRTSRRRWPLRPRVRGRVNDDERRSRSRAGRPAHVHRGSIEHKRLRRMATKDQDELPDRQSQQRDRDSPQPRLLVEVGRDRRHRDECGVLGRDGAAGRCRRHRHHLGKSCCGHRWSRATPSAWSYHVRTNQVSDRRQHPGTGGAAYIVTWPFLAPLDALGMFGLIEGAAGYDVVTGRKLRRMKPPSAWPAYVVSVVLIVVTWGIGEAAAPRAR